jgi:hypothetical protein
MGRFQLLTIKFSTCSETARCRDDWSDDLFSSFGRDARYNLGSQASGGRKMGKDGGIRPTTAVR